MDIIDFHAHIYPGKIAAKAVDSVAEFYRLKMHGEGTSDHLLSCGKLANIKKFVVHSPALRPSNVYTINSFISQECQLHPEFIGFGTLHAFMEDPEEEIERIISLGLKGIKIHPDTQLFDLDEPKMMPIYQRLEALGLPVLFHTGDYRYDYSHPRRLVHVMDKCPDLTCIAAHFGGWSIFDQGLEHLKDQSCYLDISSSMTILGKHRSRELIEIYGPDRMLFGSDFPMWRPEVELDKYMQLGFSPEINEKILHGNAAKILNLSD